MAMQTWAGAVEIPEGRQVLSDHLDGHYPSIDARVPVDLSRVSVAAAALSWEPDAVRRLYERLVDDYRAPLTLAWRLPSPG